MLIIILKSLICIDAPLVYDRDYCYYYYSEP